MPRVARIAYWATPSLFCLILYWFGLKAWFQKDDYAWLGLDLLVTDARTFLEALFRPLAQGTIRPLSERLFFMGFVKLFGIDALPFRVAVFLTMFADLVLLCRIVNRLVRSRLAGFAAACLWCVNTALSIPLSWTSAYNQILCVFFLLLAFWFFLRYTETGERRYYWFQAVAFVIGFGALEMNVVYPALAALYALCCARRCFASTLPLFAVSALYTVIHRSVAPAETDEIYRMYFDAGIFETLGTYMRSLIGATRFAAYEVIQPWVFHTAEIIAAAGILAAIAWMIHRRERLVWFFAGWFFIAIAPVLPLRNHIMDYYMTIPALGLAMLGGWAVARAWRAPVYVRAVAALVLLAYAVPSARTTWQLTRWTHDASKRARAFIQRVAYAHKLHPGKILLVSNMDSELFEVGFYGDPFRLFGLRDIYLTAESQAHIRPFEGSGPLTRYFLPDPVAIEALAQGRAVVYQIDGDRLRNMTELYRATLISRREAQELSPRVELGEAAYAAQIAEGFYPIEDGFRWMSKRGIVRVHGPRTASEWLEVKGSCPEQQLGRGPLRVTISVDGRVIGTHAIRRANGFTLRNALPPETVGKKAMEVAIEVDRTLNMPPDERRLGLVIYTVAVA